MMVQLFSAVLSFLLLSGAAWAHKVTIFAWVEGDTVYTQSKFSGGKPAKNSTVVVYDDAGNQLLEGKTDKKGVFSFVVPKRTALMVALKASMGHLAEWKISVEEVTGQPTPTEDSVAGLPANKVSERGDSTSAMINQGERRPIVVSGDGLSREELRSLIDGALDEKLAPITRMLVASQDRGPSVSDVVCGLGYIVGLMGVALYATNRNKRK
jgi:nickel transport protein